MQRRLDWVLQGEEMPNASRKQGACEQVSAAAAAQVGLKEKNREPEWAMTHPEWGTQNLNHFLLTSKKSTSGKVSGTKCLVHDRSPVPGVIANFQDAI